MIKYLPLVLLILLVYSCSNNPLNQSDKTEDTESSESAMKSDDGYDFRSTKWGMSKEEVMKTEQGEPVLDSEYRVDYITQTMGRVSRVGYTFNDDNELIRGSIFVLTAPEDKNKYIEIYKNIQTELKKKYGKTIIDTIQHRDPSQNIDPASGEAVCDGMLLYATQWHESRSDIQLLLRGEDSECLISIMYVSQEGLRKMLNERGIEQTNTDPSNE